MSYREVRNFIEMLRALNYSQLISMESFRLPNFPLVAHLLVWLAQKFDPDIDISLEINNEDQRVKLIRATAQFMALKANVKLNTKRLYQADGYAVKELLKITTILYNALNTNLDANNNQENDDSFMYQNFDLTDKVQDLKLSRQLASEITKSGANLFDLLGKEVELRSARQKSVGRQFELVQIEQGIKSAAQSISKEITETTELIDNVAATEASLDSKIERRKMELDRYEKRLQTLKKVKPAFLEEFTVLEKELEQLFVQYSIRLRCLNQLEKQFSEAERIQMEKQLASTVIPMVQNISFDKFGIDDELLELEEEISHEPKHDTGGNRLERPKAGIEGRKSRNKVIGLMQPPLSGSQSSLDLSSDSDNDLLIEKDEPELMHSDDESAAFDMSAIDRIAPSGRRTNATKIADTNSDDDF